MRTSSVQPALGTPLNRSHPLSQGLVGCWLMNEGGGLKAFDSCGFGNEIGTLTSAVFKKTHKGSGINFNGSSSYVGIDDITRLEPAKITVSCWFKTSTALEQFMVSKEDLDSGPGRSYSLRIYDTANAKVRFVVFKSGSSGTVLGTDFNDVLSAGTYADGKWHHAVATWDGVNIRLYVDAVAETPTAFSGSGVRDSTTLLEFGRSQNAGVRQWYNGDLSTVMIYNRALSHSEVRQLYNSPYQMFKNLGRKVPVEFFYKYKFNNSGIRPRPFAPGHAR